MPSILTIFNAVDAIGCRNWPKACDNITAVFIYWKRRSMNNVSSCSDPSTAAGSLYYAQQLQQTQGVNSSAAASGLTGVSGASSAGQSSASISGPGQLLSNLQQLQTQNPTQFQQVVSNIAGQLQTASQQVQGPQSSVLSGLAAKFQSVASGGSLSQLQPQQHHHHHHAQQAYSQNSQSPSQGIAALVQPSGSQSANGSTVQQLFSNISNEVSQALAG